MKEIFKNTVKIEGFRCFSPSLAIENNGFDPQAFSFLMENEDKYFWFKERNKIILSALDKHFPKIDSFLEIGCGTGYVSSAIKNKFPHIDVYGSEIFIEGLKHAAIRLKPENLFQLDARSIPFESTFDAIGMFDVLEHIDEDEKVLKEVYKALKPGGSIIITVPQHPFLWSQSDDSACHKRRYVRHELRTKLEKSGFKIKKMTSFVTILMPLLMLSRIISARKPGYSPQNEFKIHPILNIIFGATMRFEQHLIHHGFSLPYGVSLLAIAEKQSN